MDCTKRNVRRRARGSLSRPTSLGALSKKPEVRVHPLRFLLLRKGVSLADAAVLLGWSVRKLMLVVHEWRRPRDAERVARELGHRTVDLFPRI